MGHSREKKIEGYKLKLITKYILSRVECHRRSRTAVQNKIVSCFFTAVNQRIACVLPCNSKIKRFGSMQLIQFNTQVKIFVSYYAISLDKLFKDILLSFAG